MSLPTQYRYLHGEPRSSASIRLLPEDFQVTEIPSFEPEGEGEHVFLLIRKVGENTDWVARQLANFAQVPAKDVSYAGKKDRHAVTEQWFCVRFPGNRALNWSLFGGESITVLKTARHPRKLRLGNLLGNRFSIRLRNLTNEADFVERLAYLEHGVPNYFGEQRFGREGGNLEKGVALIKGEYQERQRHKKGLYISAVRSWLFNHLLSERLGDELWQRPMQGDVMMLNGSRSFFVAEELDQSLQTRFESRDILLSGPLWGRGRPLSEAQAGEWEARVIEPWHEITERLEHLGLNQERRSLVLYAEGFKAEKEAPGQWVVHFSLPAGSFATTVLRELCHVTQTGSV
ncbi:tRNA pseudouridine(13) synthase TruD [Neptunomonas phycophila]|jgi:tRNA pseudouridine13 synthase|uniref:tRNA pseudouridine synthase D n=1 Tax=Neptunomonas phycophila TaxID=1572645 RepID=A0ABT9EWW9_9GAMM|nr:tRNA pseudouridine(13) synthase TruD [Neptunomonas phycophila]MBT3144438.1 tRNA pseudouridine(13) synthase TruD [Neptunomonas phycophila]MDO6468158.1 tRNA pseudouridine(13) synthase TruD [Neptunomonas phycophila]MDP2523549.1 tRNA pseudouridine(13) synthase TruD [Neptunomonas phycophila]